jgi:hypothetical protein
MGEGHPGLKIGIASCKPADALAAPDERPGCPRGTLASGQPLQSGTPLFGLELSTRAAQLAFALALAACSAPSDPQPDPEQAPTTHDAGVLVEVDASFPNVVNGIDGGPSSPPDGSAKARDAHLADTAPDAPSRFITEVIDFEQGTCAGYGADGLPGIVEGPPVGGGANTGSTDVVSLGGGGSIIVGFGPNAIVDGPGVDFVVFENPFDYGDGDRYVEPGEVSVSDDGKNWVPFPCHDLTQEEPDGGWGATQCGGMNLVFSNPYENPVDRDQPPISPFDLAHAGGDQYDLASIGVRHANYVRIRNIVASEPCTDAGDTKKNGFDLDAVAILHAAL